MARFRCPRCGQRAELTYDGDHAYVTCYPCEIEVPIYQAVLQWRKPVVSKVLTGFCLNFVKSVSRVLTRGMTFH